MAWIRIEKDGLTKKEPGPIEADGENDDAVAPGGVKKGSVEVGEVPEITNKKYQLQNKQKQYLMKLPSPLL